MNESNSYRLGGHEAPPAIISVFVGSYLTSMLENIATESHRQEDDPGSENRTQAWYRKNS